MNTYDSLKQSLELSKVLLENAELKGDYKRVSELQGLISVIKDSLIEVYEDRFIYKRSTE